MVTFLDQIVLKINYHIKWLLQKCKYKYAVISICAILRTMVLLQWLTPHFRSTAAGFSSLQGSLSTYWLDIQCLNLASSFRQNRCEFVNYNSFTSFYCPDPLLRKRLWIILPDYIYRLILRRLQRYTSVSPHSMKSRIYKQLVKTCSHYFVIPRREKWRVTASN